MVISFVSPLLSFYHKYITLSLLINLHHFLSSFPSLFINIISHSLFLNSSLPTQVLFFFLVEPTQPLCYFTLISHLFIFLYFIENLIKEVLFSKNNSISHHLKKKKSKDSGGIWYTNSNTHFQFLNNFTRISTNFFTHIYFHISFQTTKHMFLSAYTKYPLIFLTSFSRLLPNNKKRKKEKEKR